MEGVMVLVMCAVCWWFVRVRVCVCERVIWAYRGSAVLGSDWGDGLVGGCSVKIY